MNTRSLATGTALALVTLLAACGGEGVTQPADNLSQAQVETMSSALSALLALSLFPQPASLAPQVQFNVRGVSALSLPIKGSRTCPDGGHVGVSGTFTDEDDGSLEYALSDTLVECGIKGKDSSAWTFTTQPTLEISITERFDGDSAEVQLIDVTQHDVGRVQYSSGALSGSCQVDMVLANQFAYQTPTPDSATISLHSEGTLCGRAVARDTAVTIALPSPP